MLKSSGHDVYLEKKSARDVFIFLDGVLSFVEENVSRFICRCLEVKDCEYQKQEMLVAVSTAFHKAVAELTRLSIPVERRDIRDVLNSFRARITNLRTLFDESAKEYRDNFRALQKRRERQVQTSKLIKGLFSNY